MDSRLRRIFLSPLCLANALMGALLLASGGAAAEEDSFAAMVEPQLERREVSEAAIDEEDIELGAYYGIMSVEDFGSHSAWGVRAAYHIAEWGFVEGLYGQTTIGLTSYERLSGAVRLMSDAQRDTRYYYMTLGLNLLPGEGFLLGKAYNDSLYLSGGIGSTRFAGDPRSSLLFGIGYRLLVNDWLALHLDSRLHFFSIDLLGEEQGLTNLENSLGLTVFF